MGKQEAEKKLAALPLDRAVAVVDFSSSDAKAKRRFAFAVPGGQCEIEIDADPTPEQLDTLARNLPVPDDKRAETRDKLATAKATEVQADKLR